MDDHAAQRTTRPSLSDNRSRGISLLPGTSLPARGQLPLAYIYQPAPSPTQSGQARTREWLLETSWVFLCLGGFPHTQWAEEVGIVRDDAGYLVTGPDLLRNGQRPENWPLEREPYYLETNVPGVFAAGDVRHGSIKRCASAVGEGAMAVTFVHRYLTSG